MMHGDRPATPVGTAELLCAITFVDASTTKTRDLRMNIVVVWKSATKVMEMWSNEDGSIYGLFMGAGVCEEMNDVPDTHLPFA